MRLRLAKPLSKLKLSCRLSSDDYMVLQQGQRLPVWGWAEPGESVTVSIAGQSHTTEG